MKRALTVLTAATLTQGFLLHTANATPTENTGIRILPATGPLNIDGRANDWDLSGGVFACDDVENQRDKMAVWMHAMYDSENLYLLAHFIDETPLNNPGQTIADYGFAGDSLQFRIITANGTGNERVSHWTNWQGRDGSDIMDIAYGKKFNEGAVKDAKNEGAKQAFTKDADSKGYIQEMAIPWKLLTKDGQVPAPSSSLRFTIEPNFTIGINGRMTLKDIFAPNIRPDRVFTFMAFQAWGVASLESKGKLTPKPVRLADAREFPVALENGIPAVNWNGLIQVKELPGFKNIAFTMPSDGYISLNIKDKNGVVVRQLLNSAFYSKGKHEVKWDGLTTPNARIPGQPVEAGEYTWSALWNTGTGLKLRGWAANGGSAPWDNGPGTNWGGDHGNPIAAAADATQIYLGWEAAEAGQAVVATDLKGNVKWNNKRGGIAGAKALAADGKVLYVLGGMVGGGAEGGGVYKLNTVDGKYLSWGDSTDADLKMKDLWGDKSDAPKRADSIAAAGGKLYLSFRKADTIMVLDGKTGKLEKSLKATQPTSLIVVGDQIYFVSAASSVQCLNLADETVSEIVGGLSNATGLTVSTDGRIFVGTREPDNQVKVFDTAGKSLKSIGRAGGRQLLGQWVSDGMRFIASLAVAPNGKLWVAEQDGSPRRFSLWDTQTGELSKEFFGPTTYGALGGSINPNDPNVMAGQGCEWRLDPATGRPKVVSVITRDGMENSRFVVGSNGRVYLAVSPTWMGSANSASIFERVGEGDYKLRAKFYYEKSDEKAKENNRTRYWADANGDEKEQPEEITSTNANLQFSAWYMAMAPDMTLYAKDKQLKVTGFTAAGAPIYNIANPNLMPNTKEANNVGGLGSADGKTILFNGTYGADRASFKAFDISTGQQKWWYPNNFVGVHGSHNATPPEVGMIRGAYGITGTAKMPAPLGNIWVIPTNVGEWHVLNEDGFYITKFFQGDPLRQKWPTEAIPDAPMNDVPSGMGGEDFGGSIAFGKDGKLYLQSGKTAFWNLEATGMDSFKAMNGGKIQIAASDNKEMLAMRESQMQQVVGKKLLAVKKVTVPFTGNLDKDFKGTSTISFQKTDSTKVKSSAAWDTNYLYLAWDVTDNTPWINKARNAEEMYLTGDTVDFQMGTNPSAKADRSEAVTGDFRFSIGDLNGTPTAVLYRKVSAIKQPKTFSSGIVKNYEMDYVAQIRDAKINVVKRGDGYLVEAAIPLEALGFNPEAGHTLRGDFGVTYGGESGDRTRLRNYWNNQKTGIVDDAVFELMMEPKNWGELQFAP